MRAARSPVAAVDGAVTQHRGEHRAKPCPKTTLELQRRAAPILADLHIDAVETYRYRGVTQQVEQPHLGCAERLEKYPSDSVGAAHGPVLYSRSNFPPGMAKAAPPAPSPSNAHCSAA